MTAGATLVELYIEYHNHLDGIKSNIEMVDKSYKKTITNSVWEFHTEQLQLQLEGVLSLSGIQYVKVINDQEKIVGEAGQMPEGKMLSQNYDLLYDNRGEKIFIGQISVYAGTKQIWDKLYKKLIFVFLTQFLKSFIVSALYYLVIRRLVTRHIVDISNYLKNFNLKNPYHAFKLKRALTSNQLQQKDELDILTDAINQMRYSINQSYSAIDQLNRNLEQTVEIKTKVIIEQRQKMEFATKMKSLGEMAGGMAHEINSPLAALHLSTEILLEKVKKSELTHEVFEKHLLKNQKIISRIAKIIHSLKTFSRDGSKDSLQNVLINSIIEDTLILCQEKMNAQKIKLILPDYSSLAQISCRPVEISQVLLNLLNNAYDAVSAYEKKWIKIDLQETEKQILISVTDCGLGIPEDIRMKIFQPFYSTKDVGKGTGLGLSISMGIMESHGGELMVDEASTHTRFIMIIPRNVPQIAKAS